MKVAIVGGGLVGTAVAHAIAQRARDKGRAVSVVVVERGVPGAEASWAAGGILSPLVECDHDGPMLRLCLAGLEHSYGLCARLGAAAVGLQRAPTLDVAVADHELPHLEARVAWQQGLGLPARMVSAAEVRAQVSGIGAVVGGAAFDGEGSLSPRALFLTLRASAEALGVQFQSGHQVQAVDAVRVTTDVGVVDADAVVVAAGAWTPSVVGSGVAEGAVFPVRGQMIELQLEQASVVPPVVYGAGGYVVFRGDGRVIAGSTMERAGFNKTQTVGALQKVLQTATTLLPSTQAAPLLSTWTGLRPGTADGLPLLGKSSTGVWVASGHFRNGILLAAVSGERIAAALLDGAVIDPAVSPSRALSPAA
jgi:glycine oxidase